MKVRLRRFRCKERRLLCQGDGVTVNGSTVEITKAGTYIVEGTASKVQLKVAAGKEDEVQIVFKNATLKEYRSSITGRLGEKSNFNSSRWNEK